MVPQDHLVLVLERMVHVQRGTDQGTSSAHASETTKIPLHSGPIRPLIRMIWNLLLRQLQADTSCYIELVHFGICIEVIPEVVVVLEQFVHGHIIAGFDEDETDLYASTTAKVPLRRIYRNG